MNPLIAEREACTRVTDTEGVKILKLYAQCVESVIGKTNAIHEQSILRVCDFYRSLAIQFGPDPICKAREVIGSITQITFDALDPFLLVTKSLHQSTNGFMIHVHIPAPGGTS